MNGLLEKGREGFADGTLNWISNAFKAMLLDLDTVSTAIKAITAASNATPIVITSTAHGFTNGDIVCIGKVLGNLAANGVWKVANVAANTFELQRPDGTNAVGSAAYTSGGYAVCLGPSASGDNLDDYSAARVGTDVALASLTDVQGVLGAANPTFTAVTGATVEAIAIYKDTGTSSTSRMVYLTDGFQIATMAADAALSATTIWVEPLAGGIPSGTVLTFSNGQSATLSALAAQGARSISVTALGAAITAGHRANAPITGAGLPVTPNSGDIIVQWDAGANRIVKL